MIFEEIRAAVADYFRDSWNPATLPVIHENQPAPATDAAWGRLTVLSGQADPLALGDQSVRLMGMAVLQVFIPETGGTRKATVAGDAFAAIFNRRQLRVGATTTISFKTTSMIEAGGRQGYVQKNFSVQFHADTLG